MLIPILHRSRFSFVFQLAALMALALLNLTVYSCSKSSQSSQISEELPRLENSRDLIPISLMIEDEISGRILGLPLAEPKFPRVNDRGEIFLIDAGNHRLIKFDSALEPVVERGAFGAFKGLFSDPVALALGPDQRVYIADARLDVIQRFDENLSPIDELLFDDEEDGMRFGRPAGLALTSDNNLWITDQDQRRIAVFDRYFTFQRFYADYTDGGVGFERPGAALDVSDQRIAVCDRESARILIFDQLGFQRLVFGDEILREPTDIAEDSYGRFWVTDSELDELLCFSSEGEFLFRSGQLNQSFRLRFTDPVGVCFVGAEILGLADSGGNRLLLLRIISD